MVASLGFGPRHSPGLSWSPLPVGIGSHKLVPRARFELALQRTSSVCLLPLGYLGLVLSVGFQPTLSALEGRCLMRSSHDKSLFRVGVGPTQGALGKRCPSFRRPEFLGPSGIEPEFQKSDFCAVSVLPRPCKSWCFPRESNPDLPVRSRLSYSLDEGSMPAAFLAPRDSVVKDHLSKWCVLLASIQ